MLLEYGKGRFWDSLIKDRASAIKAGVKAKDVDKLLGKIQQAKRQMGGEIRADAQGNLYKFDKGHKSAKVHLERMQIQKGKLARTEEVDPVTGKVLKEILKGDR